MSNFGVVKEKQILEKELTLSFIQLRTSFAIQLITQICIFRWGQYLKSGTLSEIIKEIIL